MYGYIISTEETPVNIPMDELRLQPVKVVAGVKYKVLQLTDIKLHTTPKRPTSFVKKVRESFQNNTPGRIYNPLPENLALQDDDSFDLEQLRHNQDVMRMVREEEAKGYKVVIAIPKKGIPVFPGEDTIEFLNSKNGKRILRKLDKNKN